MDLIGVISKTYEMHLTKQQPHQQQIQVPIVDYLQFWIQVKAVKNLLDLCQICFVKSYKQQETIFYKKKTFIIIIIIIDMSKRRRFCLIHRLGLAVRSTGAFAILAQ